MLTGEVIRTLIRYLFNFYRNRKEYNFASSERIFNDAFSNLSVFFKIYIFDLSVESC